MTHSPPDLHVRELNLADERDFELALLHIEELYAELFGSGTAPSPGDSKRLRQQLVARPARHWAFLAGDAGGEPVAFAMLAESFAVFARGYYGIINELWVKAERRGAGVGSTLIDYCVEFGRNQGWRRIDVSAPVDPRWDSSFEFYRKQGFVLTGRKLKYVVSE
jgi:GNAT superfamily N-acetyltransferase